METKTHSSVKTIALVIMVKNEETQILNTLTSFSDYVDMVIVYDTESKDNTVSVIQKFCSSHDLPLYLIEGVFIDFSVSRNILIEYANQIKGADYLLLVDSNDEIQSGNKLLEFVNNTIPLSPELSNKTAYYVTHIWKKGENQHRFKNINLLKTPTDWRFKCQVHEYLHNGTEVAYDFPSAEFVIYQDRDKDNQKSSNRYLKDKKILLSEYVTNKTPRTVFYMARTCRLLNDIDNAIRYYKERITMTDSFWEEKYHSMYELADIYPDWETKRKWYMNAWELGHRVEPLVRMAEHYRQVKDAQSMYMVLSIACDLSYPSTHKLFVNVDDYEYTRWHLMSIVAFYMKKFELGLKSSRIAYTARKLDEDLFILRKYRQRNKMIGGKVTKQEYIEKRMKDYSGMQVSQTILLSLEDEWDSLGIDN